MAYARLFPADLAALDAKQLVSSAWTPGNRRNAIHAAERILNFRVAAQLGGWLADAPCLDQAVGSIVARRIDPWREGDEIPVQGDWQTRKTRLGIDVNASSRSAYISSTFKSWRDRFVDLNNVASVASVFQRGQTKPLALGQAAAIERLYHFIERIRKGMRVNAVLLNQGAPFARDVLDPLGWHALFGLVVDEEIRKAGRWKIALRNTTPGSEEYCRLLAVYAEPYVPGPLGVSVWAAGQTVMAFKMGNAFDSRIDWYGFATGSHGVGVTIPGVVEPIAMKAQVVS